MHTVSMPDKGITLIPCVLFTSMLSFYAAGDEYDLLSLYALIFPYGKRPAMQTASFYPLLLPPEIGIVTPVI